MNYRYEVTWDSEVDDPMNEGEKCRYMKDFFDIADARECLILHRGKNSSMKVIPLYDEERR